MSHPASEYPIIRPAHKVSEGVSRSCIFTEHLMLAVPSGKKHTVKILTERVRLIDSFHPVRGDFLE
ncbi:MAG: hypothetical protein JW881_05385 [Spirochaetales bacterium]|nr:hypothetical protein [Spirochaetales bacterium]